ncbi:MAG TPA: hypothetical protein PLK34_00210 [Candidatus Pacearchaeota archaeon]|nr:hypothetical protein [Candidatus Pacearchaeota archaeon]
MRGLDPSKKRVLNYQERTRIEQGFKDWRDRPSRIFKEVLTEYGLSCEQASRRSHYHIRFPGISEFITVSFTPSDGARFAQNSAHTCINYIERHYPGKNNSPEKDNKKAVKK